MNKCYWNNYCISIIIFLYGNMEHMASSTDAYSRHPDNIIKKKKKGKAIIFLAYWLRTLRRLNWKLLSYLSSCWLPNVKHRRPVKCEKSKTLWRTRAWALGVGNYKQWPTVSMQQKCRNPAPCCQGTVNRAGNKASDFSEWLEICSAVDAMS